MGTQGSKRIAKNALLNIIKQVSDIIFPLITFPYVARTLGKENYGKVEWANSIIGYFVMFAVFGVTSYAVREGARKRNDKDSLSSIMSELFTLNIFITIIAYITLGFMVSFWTKMVPYRKLILLMSTTILFSIIGLEHIYTIFEDFKYITIRSIIIKLISLTGLFIFVKQAEDYYFYALILVISTAGANVFNYIHARKYVNIKIVFKPSIVRHIRPMTIFFINSLMVTLYVSSDITMLGLYCSDAVVGMYGSSAKIYNIIKRCINAITAVVIPHAIILKNAEKHDEYIKTLNSLLHLIATIIFPAITGLFCLSPNVILIMAGEDYLLAKESLRILCFSMPFAVMSNMLISLVSIPFNKEKTVAIATCISAIANVLLNFILIPLWGQNAAALTTVIAEIIVFSISLWTMIKLHIKVNARIRDILSILCGCTLIYVSCTIVKSFHLDNAIETMASVMLSVAVYSLVMIVSKNEMVQFLKRLIKK